MMTVGNFEVMFGTVNLMYRDYVHKQWSKFFAVIVHDDDDDVDNDDYDDDDDDDDNNNNNNNNKGKG
jgi:hypothetical protein